MMKFLQFFADSTSGSRERVSNAINSLPHTNTDTVRGNIVNVVMYAAGLVAIVMIVISAIQMTTSAGNPSAVGKAKKTLVGAIIGLLIVVLSYSILNFVLKIFE